MAQHGTGNSSYIAYEVDAPQGMTKQECQQENFPVSLRDPKDVTNPSTMASAITLMNWDTETRAVRICFPTKIDLNGLDEPQNYHLLDTFVVDPNRSIKVCISPELFMICFPRRTRTLKGREEQESYTGLPLSNILNRYLTLRLDSNGFVAVDVSPDRNANYFTVENQTGVEVPFKLVLNTEKCQTDIDNAEGYGDKLGARGNNNKSMITPIIQKIIDQGVIEARGIHEFKYQSLFRAFVEMPVCSPGGVFRSPNIKKFTYEKGGIEISVGDVLFLERAVVPGSFPDYDVIYYQKCFRILSTGVEGKYSTY